MKTDNPAPDAILTDATGKLRHVMVLGFDGDGNDWIRSSTSDLGVILVLLEVAKAKALASATLTDDED